MMVNEETGARMDAAMDRLEVTVGNAAFEPGRTQVTLHADGQVQALMELDGSRTHRIEAKLDPERATGMLRAAAETMAKVRAGSPYGLPDEPRYRFELGTGDGRQVVEVWRSDLPDHPELEQIVAELQRVVDEQAKGEIIL
jgi:hypothetical protein